MGRRSARRVAPERAITLRGERFGVPSREPTERQMTMTDFIKVSIERAKEILSDELGDAVQAGELVALAQFRIDAQTAIAAHEQAAKDDAKEIEMLKTLLEAARVERDDLRAKYLGKL